MSSNRELVDHLVQSGYLQSESLIRAFEKIDRFDFVPSPNKKEAYGDYPLPIGANQTISQPATVAFMLELLQPCWGEKILDVGSGSGWTTALLASAVGEKGKVVGVEVAPTLAVFGRDNLKKYHFQQAEIRLAGKELGLPQEAPFDKILVSAAAEKLPEELVEQLKIGGCLVLPIQNSVWRIERISDKKTKKEEFPGFVFVPLITK